jgi:hypothetical protein
MKVPPWTMFATQIYATLLGAGLNYVVMTSIVTSQRQALLSSDSNGNGIWSGTYMQSLNAQAITWALAKQMYGLGGRYVIVRLGLLIGACVPGLHYGVCRIFPIVRKWELNFSIIFAFACVYYYGNTSWIWSSIAVGIISQVWLRRRHPNIFNKYNYLIGGRAGRWVADCHLHLVVCCVRGKWDGASISDVVWQSVWECGSRQVAFDCVGG